MKKVALRHLLRQIATTPVLVFHGYGTGKIYETDLIEQFIEPANNIEFWRNSKLEVPGSLIGVDYPYPVESIEVDVEVHRKTRVKNRKTTLRTGYEVKYQSCSGSAEDKIVASAHRLALLIRARKLDRGFIVIGGNAWTPLPLYAAAAVHPKVEVISEAKFMQMAANRKL